MVKITRLIETSGKHDFYIHHHTELEINLFESGRGIYLISGKEYHFENGDIFGNNEIHMVSYVDPSEQMITLKMHFDPQFLWNNTSGMLDESYLKIFYEREGNIGNKLSHDICITQKIRKIMLSMEEEYTKKEFDYERIIKSYLVNALILIIRHFKYHECQKTDNIYKKQNYVVIKKVLDYIEKNYTGNIRIDDLAYMSNMSKNNFIHIFKKLNGMSPYNFIILKRVNHAIRLLIETDKTILDIINLSGFNNPVNFYKLFKKYTGKTPSEIRNKYLN